MNIRIGKAVSLFALCLVVPMGIARAQVKGVTCGDGTTSAAVGKGACSGHGGVKAKPATKTTPVQAGKAKLAAKSETKTAKPDTKTAKTTTKTTTKTATTTAKPDTKAATKSKAPAAKTASAASASDKDPKNATASCKDGTYSHAATHTGACSGHGGVLKFLKP